MRVATIVRDKRGRYHVRIGDQAQPNGDVTVVEILNGFDEDELRRKARRLISELKEHDG